VNFQRVRVLLLPIFGLLSIFAKAADTAASGTNTDVSPDVVAKVGAVWNFELQGDRISEMKWARELTAGPGPDWVISWAKGVVFRLSSQGKPIEMAFTSIDGKEVDLRALKGHVVLVDFWATWCAPCTEELPGLEATYSRLHSKGLEVVGISWDNDIGKLARFATEKKIPWPQYCDGQKPGKWGLAFGIGGVPYTILVDKAGNVRFFGASVDHSKLEERLSLLLAE